MGVEEQNLYLRVWGEAELRRRRQASWEARAYCFVIWSAADAHFPWFAFPLLGWGIILAVHGVYDFVMKTPEDIMMERAAAAEQPVKPVPS